MSFVVGDRAVYSSPITGTDHEVEIRDVAVGLLSQRLYLIRCVEHWGCRWSIWAGAVGLMPIRVPCPACLDGLDEPAAEVGGVSFDARACQTCGGSGQVFERCPECHGSRKVVLLGSNEAEEPSGSIPWDESMTSSSPVPCLACHSGPVRVPVPCSEEPF